MMVMKRRRMMMMTNTEEIDKMIHSFLKAREEKQLKKEKDILEEKKTGEGERPTD